MNRLKNYNIIGGIKNILPKELHKLVDEYDQEHGLVIGEGASIKGMQAPFPKPPNVVSVHPLI